MNQRFQSNATWYQRRARSLLSCVDRLAPELTGWERQQARLLAGFSMIGVIVGLSFVALFAYIGLWTAWSPLLVATLAMAAIPLVLHRTKSLIVCSHMFAAVVVAVSVAVAIARGGLAVSALMFAATVPILVTFLLGKRAALLWTTLTVAIFIAFSALNSWLPGGIPSQFQASQAQMSLIDTTGMLLLVLTCAALSLLFERARRSAVEQAQRASRAKSMFLANMSHELRTPLNAIIGYSEMLIEDTGHLEPQVIQRDAERINMSAVHLLGLIANVLDLSKIESEKLELHIVELNPMQLMDEVRTMLEKAANEKGLAFHCEVTTGIPPCVLGDANRIKQVIANLVSNAIKFTDSGSITIAMYEVQRQEGYSVLAIDVADTGIGISEEDQEKIFEAFSQADNSPTRRFGGTGLGLTICRRLVERMGGTIEVKSSGPGTGSTFQLTLELPVVDQPTMQEYDPLESPPHQTH